MLTAPLRAIAPAEIVEEYDLIAVIPDAHTGHIAGISADGTVWGWPVFVDNTLDWSEPVQAEFLCPTFAKILQLLGIPADPSLLIEDECHQACIDGTLWENPSLANTDLTKPRE